MAARQGRPPKPVEQKRALGNPGKRALPKPPTKTPASKAPAALPAAPPDPVEVLTPSRPLQRAGLALWQNAWLHGYRWLAITDVELLLMVCEQIDERAALRLRVLQTKDWRDRAALRQLESAIRDGLAALGFSPEARARLALGEVEIQNAIERYREQAARLAGQPTKAG